MIPFAFFGSSEFSISVLETLKTKGVLPTLVITTPDKPKGRGLALLPTVVKVWAQKNNVPILDPVKLDDVFVEKLKKYSTQLFNINHWPLFIVASYGKIIPQSIIDLPLRKTLNIHPSLLPKYRGASPIQNTIIDDTKDTGVTIIRLDCEMDHGPIVAVEKIRFDEWQIYEKIEEKLGTVGGNLLSHILPDWMDGKIKEVPQNHTQATFTKKIVKEDGLLDIDDISPTAPIGRAYPAFLKIQAYHAWPGAFFFLEKHNETKNYIKKADTLEKTNKKIRVKITSASWCDDKLVIEKVIPEGKKEMSYKDFLMR